MPGALQGRTQGERMCVKELPTGGAGRVALGAPMGLD